MEDVLLLLHGRSPPSAGVGLSPVEEGLLLLLTVTSIAIRRPLFALTADERRPTVAAAAAAVAEARSTRPPGGTPCCPLEMRGRRRGSGTIPTESADDGRIGHRLLMLLMLMVGLKRLLLLTVVDILSSS